MKDLNPYEELGLARDVSPQAVKSAYRAQAKVHHPDVGGDPIAWERMRLAYAVLSDPARRKTYDDTGRIEDDRPDNDRAAALQVIEMHMGTMINTFINSGFAPINDPRAMDMVVQIQGAILAEIDQAEEGIKGGEKVAAFMTDLRARFTSKEAAEGEGDPIIRGLDRQIAHAQEQIAGMRMAIRVRRLAHDIVGGYEYRQDAPSQWPTGFTVSGMADYGEARTRMYLGDDGMVHYRP